MSHAVMFLKNKMEEQVERIQMLSILTFSLFETFFD